jgi:Fur family transcriptional regulator, zinc uptake regulator
MAAVPAKAPFAAPDKNDGKRLTQMMERAEGAFEKKELRFTKLRQQVFGEIAATHASIGAYEIMARMAEKGTRVAPISVYRAIDALLDVGLIHRLESKNAFFACRRVDHTSTGRRPIFLSCESCGTVAEVDGQDIFDLADERARGIGFSPRIKFVEIQGMCPRCAEKAEKK